MTGRLELPTFPVAPAAPPPVPGCASPGECDGLIGRAKALSWLSLAWMTHRGRRFGREAGTACGRVRPAPPASNRWLSATGVYVSDNGEWRS